MLNCLHRPAFPVLLALFFAALCVFSGCGSENRQMLPSPTPTIPLPPAVPAAEPVLLYVGTGTSPADVSAIQNVLRTSSIGFATADASGLTALKKEELGGYKLIIIPGGNSITIGDSLSQEVASNIRIAVQHYGTNYLGICAGAFFGGLSFHNGVNLTGGVAFNFYADESKGIHKSAVEISFPSSNPLDVYWEDGPQLSGWGEVVAKFPDGTPAITQGKSGEGFVVFTGVHLEAPESWRGTLVFGDPASASLDYAATVMQAALNGSSLPHF